MSSAQINVALFINNFSILIYEQEKRELAGRRKKLWVEISKFRNRWLQFLWLLWFSVTLISFASNRRITWLVSQRLTDNHPCDRESATSSAQVHASNHSNVYSFQFHSCQTSFVRSMIMNMRESKFLWNLIILNYCFTPWSLSSTQLNSGNKNS